MGIADFPQSEPMASFAPAFKSFAFRTLWPKRAVQKG